MPIESYLPKSISTDALETIYWLINKSLSVPAICKKNPSNYSKAISTFTFTSISHDNPPILQSLYPILNSLNINTSKFNDKPLDIIFFNNLLSEVSCVLRDNNININLEKWGGRGKKYFFQIPSVEHLKYDRFKQNVKQKKL